MSRFSLSPRANRIEVDVLNEDRVRDQLSAAEGLIYIRTREPAASSGGAALEGALRLRGGRWRTTPPRRARYSRRSSPPVRSTTSEHELLYRILTVRDRLMHGYAPGDPSAP